MPCKACGEDEGLEVCLGCGHRFCRMHRADRGGVPTCTGCVKERAERERKLRERLEQTSASEAEAIAAGAVVKAPAPLVEPPSAMRSALFGLAVAAPAALYLHWLGGRLTLEHDLPTWTQAALTVLGGLFAFAGVWAIAKSKSR